MSFIGKKDGNIQDMDNREQKIEELLNRGVAEVIDREHLKARLLSGEKLRVKLGIDPTSRNLHLGRSVPLLKLRDFQDLGCQVVFIVGDFTAEIGDTSDKDSERPMLSSEEVRQNMETYLAQAFKILDKDKTEVKHNSEWFKDMKLEQIGTHADAFSVAEFISRENIKKRLDEGKRVSLREMLYPVFQGIDSLKVEAAVELGGTDQRFNLLAGRKLQSAWAKEPQDILMTNLILGTDGRKMSSSWGNTINLTDAPNDMFGKVMSIPDELIETYFVHCTRVSLDRVKEIIQAPNPRDAKLRLAEEIVKMYHGADEAVKAEQYFVETFSKGQIPENVAEVKVADGMNLIDVLVAAELAVSKSEARRKIEQGGVSCEDEKLMDPNLTLTVDYQDKIIKVGKKDFVKITF
ncbi:MAG: tyrosine--tRNA ligase [Candidatus Moraniibacteriota bacterium]|nr:MAG: tyrosine--tRNA ligase [Candidatus Moranbacteria bacterium]